MVTYSTTDQFVDCAKFLPTTATVTVVADRAFLLAATKRAAAIAAAKHDGHGQIDLRIDPMNTTVLPVLSERGDVAAPGHPADVDGLDEDDLQVRFNAAYLLDALGTFTDDQVTLHINGVTKPMVLTDTPAGLVDPAAFRYLVMPARRQDT